MHVIYKGKLKIKKYTYPSKDIKFTPLKKSTPTFDKIITHDKIRTKITQVATDLWYTMYGPDKISESIFSNILGTGHLQIVKVDEKHYKIKNLFTKSFARDVIKYINKGRKLIKMFDIITERKFLLFKQTYVIVHTFFIPDIYALLLDLYAKTRKKEYAIKAVELKRDTWLSSVDNVTIKTKLHYTRLNDVKWTLKPFQKEFIDNYPILKDKLQLRGYILAFDQGLGKTFTSLVLMHLLQKDLVIIVCPKTLMFNWKTEIQSIFKNPPKDNEILLIGEGNYNLKKVRYIITNYERLNEVKTLLQQINAENIGLIVDECQNFRNVTAKRTQNLLALSHDKRINDILLLSGTPIKSNYAELAPYLYLIDPRFDDEALKIWMKVFNVDESIASDIIRYRLQLISFRKLKTDVLQLPEKKHITKYVSIPNIDKYTIETFKRLVKEEFQKRIEKYSSKFNKYYTRFLSLLQRIRNLAESYNKELVSIVDEYIEYVRQSRNGNLFVSITEEQRRHILQLESQIEKFLTDIKQLSLKKEFKQLKTLVLRLAAKVLGEVIGNLLSRLRRDLVYDIFKYNISEICNIIQQSTKTVIFTYSSAVVNDLKHLLEKHCKVMVVTLTGQTSDREHVVKTFKQKAKVLIATYQVAAVGLTLTEADTMLYADKPYRESDLKQAEDRIYRIGQDKPVKIIYLKLRSSKKTIQDRIDEIVKYFGTIIGLVVDTSHIIKQK